MASIDLRCVNDLPIAQCYLLAGIASQFHIVRHHHNSLALNVEPVKQVNNGLSVGTIQIAGRFVGQQQVGTVGHSSMILLIA